MAMPECPPHFVHHAFGRVATRRRPSSKRGLGDKGGRQDSPFSILQANITDKGAAYSVMRISEAQHRTSINWVSLIARQHTSTTPSMTPPWMHRAAPSRHRSSLSTHSPDIPPRQVQLVPSARPGGATCVPWAPTAGGSRTRARAAPQRARHAGVLRACGGRTRAGARAARRSPSGSSGARSRASSGSADPRTSRCSRAARGVAQASGSAAASGRGCGARRTSAWGWTTRWTGGRGGRCRWGSVAWNRSCSAGMRSGPCGTAGGPPWPLSRSGRDGEEYCSWRIAWSRVGRRCT